jgi:hypothetical protein
MHQSSSSLRDLLYQFVNTFKGQFDSNKVHGSCQNTEVANAKLSPFEKTYVSFPEFVDAEPRHNSARSEQWQSQRKALAC